MKNDILTGLLIVLFVLLASVVVAWLVIGRCIAWACGFGFWPDR